MQLDFSGKKAVVTGGANGMGLATARVLASSGAEVWVFDLASERPAEVAAGFGARACEVDVTEPNSIRAGLERSGAPDVLVLSAGVGIWGDLENTPREVWEKTIAVNLGGVFHIMQAAARLMKPARRGSIVMVASTNSYDGEAALVAYNASKAGLLGILHTSANELGPYGIRVNAVCPGLIRTRMTQSVFADANIIKPYFQDVPLGRGGEPEEVARAIAFLASDAASYISGAALLVDGGQMAGKFGTWNEQIGEFKDGAWRLR
jgi:meso-butanediol dehydrogenase/(S,S)-butanediol dehydrogenase/diacetyl reductase